jgi:hypothetical protein
VTFYRNLLLEQESPPKWYQEATDNWKEFLAEGGQFRFPLQSVYLADGYSQVDAKVNLDHR